MKDDALAEQSEALSDQQHVGAPHELPFAAGQGGADGEAVIDGSSEGANEIEASVDQELLACFFDLLRTVLVGLGAVAEQAAFADAEQQVFDADSAHLVDGGRGARFDGLQVGGSGDFEDLQVHVGVGKTALRDFGQNGLDAGIFDPVGARATADFQAPVGDVELDGAAVGVFVDVEGAEHHGLLVGAELGEGQHLHVQVVEMRQVLGHVSGQLAGAGPKARSVIAVLSRLMLVLAERLVVANALANGLEDHRQNVVPVGIQSVRPFVQKLGGYAGQ